MLRSAHEWKGGEPAGSAGCSDSAERRRLNLTVPVHCSVGPLLTVSSTGLLENAGVRFGDDVTRGMTASASDLLSPFNNRPSTKEQLIP